MALLWFDGFETVASTSESPNRWVDNVATSSGNGRYGGRAGTWGSGITARMTPPSPASTFVVGLAWKMTSNDVSVGRYIVQFNEGATMHLGLEYTDGTAQKFRVRHGNGTVIGTCTMDPWAANQFTHVQMKVVVHDTTGSVEVRVNGAVAFTATNIDTRNGGTGVVDTMGFRGDFTAYWDDMWLDSSDFLGDCKVEAPRPTGAGTTTQFTPSAGSNWQNVDDTTHNSDTDYNASSTAGHIDLFALGNLATTAGTVKGVQVRNVLRKDDAGSRTARAVVRTGSTNYEGSDRAVGDSYTGYTDLWVQNPNTAADWTISDVNALEAGYKIQS